MALRRVPMNKDELKWIKDELRRTKTKRQKRVRQKARKKKIQKDKKQDPEGLQASPNQLKRTISLKMNDGRKTL